MVDVARHARHLSLPDVGMEGQRRLNQASVLIVGAGGLGSPAALYLAAAGVGRLGLIDNDAVELSNLQRQIIHSTADVGTAKVESAKATLHDLDPNIVVEVFHERLKMSAAADEICVAVDNDERIRRGVVLKATPQIVEKSIADSTICNKVETSSRVTCSRNDES